MHTPSRWKANCGWDATRSRIVWHMEITLLVASDETKKNKPWQILLVFRLLINVRDSQRSLPRVRNSFGRLEMVFCGVPVMEVRRLFNEDGEHTLGCLPLFAHIFGTIYSNQRRFHKGLRRNASFGGSCFWKCTTRRQQTALWLAVSMSKHGGLGHGQLFTR